MKRFLKWVLIVICVLAAIPVLGILGVWGMYYNVIRSEPGTLAVKAAPGTLGAHVNPFIATGGVPWMCGHNTPAATTPFGMVRLGPDTASILIDQTGFNRSGYFFGDNKTLGFSHTRLVGADALEGGSFRIFPTVAARAAKLRNKENRFARFSHRQETAFPGYYAVYLPKDRVLAELTVSPRAGVHRYTFRKNDAPHLLVDVTSSLGDRRTEDGVVMVLPDERGLEGSVRAFGSFSGRYGGLDIYFAARFSQPFASYGAWNGDEFSAGSTGTAGNDIGVDLGFEKRDGEQVVEVRLALSYVSIQNARENLKAEAADRTFEDVYAAAREAWESRLARIRIQGGTDRQQRIFYTALYRPFQMPTVFTDVNGEFRGFDKSVHKADGFLYYTDFSLWDTFRAIHPLYNLIARDDHRDMMLSLLEMAKQGGAFPRWPSGCGYTNCMFGTPADVAVSEAYLKGIRGFDIETAYQAMRQTALVGRPPDTRFAGREGLESYLSLGYCASDRTGDAVSATLEYAWADHALSLLARELGHTEDADTFAQHAQFYRNLWNPETQFFMPKDSMGHFAKDFKPLLLSYVDFDRKYTRHYVEGSAMQWRWAVPFDAEGLISLFSSPDYFVAELEKYLAGSKPGVGSWNPGGNYWHGNEPYIHAAYLFNAAGRPDLTQKWVRWILETKYGDDYYGLDGNDDGGTLSAWYVFSALGFYPIPGTTKYWLGSPLFDRAEINLGDNVLTVVAENNSAENVYVKKVSLNDVPLDRPCFTHDEIAPGGMLRFEMSPTPPEP
jgi:predicted alpha-1,2-mannosidase